jgi:hypothetical protein
LLHTVGATLALATVFSIGYVGASSVNAGAGAPTWSGTGASLPANADPGSTAELLATACPAAGNCVAVGAYATGGHPTGLVDTQSNGGWTATQVPTPGNAEVGGPSEVLTVACPAVGSCVAAGVYFDGSGTAQGLLLTQSGGSWSAAEAPLPPGAGSDPQVTLLTSSCWAPGACIVAGLYRDSGANPHALILTLSGGSWTIAAVSLPANANADQVSQLFAASCGAPGSCAVVGNYADNASGEQGLVLTLSGGAWSATEAPLPADAGSPAAAEMVGVSCPAAASCTVIGQYTGTDSHRRSVIESVANGSVTGIEAPLPADALTSGSSPSPGNVLFGLSCPSTQYCVATGAYVSTASSLNGASPLIETLSGGTWTPTGGPGIDPTASSILWGVSCSWPGSCAAVGTTSSGPGAATGFIETLTNGSWSESPVTLPPNAAVPNNVMVGIPGGIVGGSPVSCSGGTCVLAGSFVTTGGIPNGFINAFPNLAGYQLVASDGGIFAFNAPYYGSMGGQPLNQPVVGMATVPDSGGYYEAASDGGIFAFNAPYFGSMGGQHLNKPIVGIAFDSRTGGYYEVASDGGIFAFNAPFYGSMGGQSLNKPIVGIAFDAQTGGYYEVASDGGIFAFNAPFQGSTGGTALNKPVVGMAVDGATGGYYEVASDGGLFAFGAPFQGSMGGQALNRPVAGMAYDYLTGGYYEVASDGGIFAFNSPYQGSTGSLSLNKPVVGMAFG